MRKGVIYRAKSLDSGKCYIGQTVQKLKRRMLRHISDAFNCDSDLHFHRALRKYGKDRWEWTIVEENINEVNLNDREVFWIDKFNSYKNGYNMNEGGGRPLFELKTYSLYSYDGVITGNMEELSKMTGEPIKKVKYVLMPSQKRRLLARKWVRLEYKDIYDELVRVYTFVHKNGDSFFGWCNDFCRKYNFNVSMVRTRILTGGSYKGWKLKKQ